MAAGILLCIAARPMAKLGVAAARVWPRVLATAGAAGQTHK